MYAIDLLKAIVGTDDVQLFWKYRNKIIKRSSRLDELILKFIRRRYGCGIPATQQINPFLAPHGFYGIFISQKSSVGNGCIIYQHVKIGVNQLDSSKGKGFPTIGNNVLIGAGAKIIGAVRIGNNVRIGANCVVVEDVPDNCTVVMNKARIIKHDLELDNTLLDISEMTEK